MGIVGGMPSPPPIISMISGCWFDFIPWVLQITSAPSFGALAI